MDLNSMKTTTITTTAAAAANKLEPISVGSSNSCGGMMIMRRRRRIIRQKDLMKARIIITRKAEEEGLSSSSSLSLSKMTTTMEPQVQEMLLSRNRLGRHTALATMASCGSLLVWPRRRNLVHLSAWATLLLTLLSLLSGTRWFETEAIKLQPDGRDKFHWTKEQFVITCQNNNNIKNVKIRWYGPNELEIPEDRSQRVHTESSGPHGHRLVVHNATAPIDEGRYRCTLGSTDDRNPRESIDFRLKLYKATNFEGTDDNVVLQAGETGSLICHVEFDPSISPATVSWARGSDKRPIELLNDSSYRVLDYDPARQISQLVVSNVNKAHDDVYTCSASAITEHLSKISDHKIRLETIYAPHFDQLEHTVWIERADSLGRSGQASAGAGHSMSPRPSNMGPGGRRHNNNNSNKQHYPQPSSPGRPRPSPAVPADGTSNNGTMAQEAQIVSVELRCSCEANPPASIRWSSPGTNFVLAKGDPGHILDERLETEGRNTTSILIVGYSLDQNWPHKQDSYICSASNRFGKATKTYNIEQSDPPPAFSVGPQRSYNSQSKLYEFTLLGPNWSPAGDQGGRQRTEIVPPVDSFRIRASSASSSSSQQSYDGGQRSRQQLNEPSVQWSLNGNGNGNGNNQQQQLQQLPLQLSLPQNFTVSLSRLPSGNQRLYLEAHNAVGWSPNATYLGDYYIVSGASTLAQIQNHLLHLCCPLIMASLLVSVSSYGFRPALFFIII